jgi:sugar O-acyltransferase (sialic acid O-acetyltransferase NeuD family)
VKKRDLYIVGAGDFGRELESHLDRVPESERAWRIAGYLDDNPAALEGYPSDYGIVGSIGDFQFQSSDLAIVAIATPGAKRRVIEGVRGRVEFLTFVSPDAIIGKFVKIGTGCIIGPHVIVGTNVILGDAVFINSGSMIGHDVTIGSFSSFMANNNIAGRCRIGEAAYFASTVTVIPGRSICDGAFIGVGSVVIRNVKERRTVYGNPARYI